MPFTASILEDVKLCIVGAVGEPQISVGELRVQSSGVRAVLTMDGEVLGTAE